MEREKKGGRGRKKGRKGGRAKIKPISSVEYSFTRSLGKQHSFERVKFGLFVLMADRQTQSGQVS